MIYYASLGHQRQPIAAYVEGTAPDVRNFPISIRVTSGVDATLTYPAGAWMTAEDVLLYFNETIKPELEAALAGLIEAHNTDENLAGGFLVLHRPQVHEHAGQFQRLPRHHFGQQLVSGLGDHKTVKHFFLLTPPPVWWWR